MSTRDQDPRTAIDLDALERDLDALEGLADRVRLSSYALASPLAAARRGQMAAELARVERRKGAAHPEVVRRRANLERAVVRFTLLAEERERSRVQRPDLDTQTATVWGRVTDTGLPRDGMVVSAEGDGVRIAFACTDGRGGFSMTVPPRTPLRLSVRGKEGAELYRDREEATLSLGQQLYREIDLTRGAGPPCPEPGEPATPGPDTFAMVDLVGQPERNARGVILQLGLLLGRRSTEAAPEQVGLILSHDPAAGARVRRGDAVSIVVGVTLDVAVPDLIGLTLERAEVLVRTSGLDLGVVTQVPVSAETAGLILDQSPAPGTMVDPGSAVDVSIGVQKDTGPAVVRVPDVTGRSLEAATALLRETGLERGPIRDVPVAEEKVGLVVNQSPPAGTRVAQGSAVGLIVGRPEGEEPSEVSVPDLRRRTLRDAEAILTNTRLSLGDVKGEPAGTALVGLVLDQSPDPGTVVQPGTPVSLVVGEPLEGPSDVRVPLVTGRRGAEAEEILKAAGLDPAVTTERVSNRAQVGVVLRQDPAARSAVRLGSAVRIVVGEVLSVGGGETVRFRELLAMTEADVGSDLGLDERLRAANIGTIEGIDRVLEMDRRKARELFGVGTLRQTDSILRALKLARERQGG